MAVINFLEVVQESRFADAVADYVMIIPEEIFCFLGYEDSESAQGFTVKAERLNQVVLYARKFCFCDLFYRNVGDEVRNIFLHRLSVAAGYYGEVCGVYVKCFDDGVSEAVDVNPFL